MKNNIKNDIVRKDWLILLQKIISTAIYINNWIYKQWLEKQSINALIVISKRNYKQEESWTQEHYKDYNLQIINLNMTQEYLKHIKELECF